MGTGQPKGVPRPVVKSTICAPLAARAQDATRSLPGADPEGMTENFAEYILSVASGRKTLSEELPKTDLAIFKDGVTL